MGVVARESDVTESLLCFLADDRLKIPMAEKYETLNDKKEKRGKSPVYEKEPKEVAGGTCNADDGPLDLPVNNKHTKALQTKHR